MSPPVPLHSPAPSAPNCACPPCSAGRGLLYWSPGLRTLEHTSWPALGFLILKRSWPGCLLQIWHHPWLRRCLPGAAQDLWQPHAARSPLTWGPGSCPPEPWRAHQSLDPGQVLLHSRGQPVLCASVSAQAGLQAPACGPVLLALLDLVPVLVQGLGDTRATGRAVRGGHSPSNAGEAQGGFVIRGGRWGTCPPL